MTVNFTECDTCREKLGTPYLCRGCIANRKTIEWLEQEVSKLRKQVQYLENDNSYICYDAGSCRAAQKLLESKVRPNQPDLMSNG